jgi:DNA adenine methylase
MAAIKTINNPPRRPILRYHGGKWLLAPWIVSHFPKHRIYVEPYGGAASVLLRKSRSYAEIYNDLDGEIVNVFRMVRDRGDELRDKLRLTPFARVEYVRSFEPCEDEMEQARRTIVRSFMGRGADSLLRKSKSGFRVNARSNGTTPSRDWIHLSDALNEIISRMQDVVIECREAMAVMKTYNDAETLYYIDPPYVKGTKNKNTHGNSHGYRHEMTDDQHAELCDTLKALHGYVVVSGYDHEIYRDGLKGWHVEKKAALADGAGKRVEYLWMSPNIKVQQRLID